MEPEDLADVDAQFFAVFQNDKAVAIGALKAISDDHGEIKSMHVSADKRGQGLADVIIDELIQCAQRLRMKRISLETGSQDAFRAARAFYKRHGFQECEPFGAYKADPHSVFMTRML